MKQQLKALQDFIQQNQQLSPQEKEALLKSVKEADKEFTITEFKLDRTEKVKRTTAILLEETIEELEQKRKAVEAQNHELEIEAALEKVRSRSLAVHKVDEFNEVIKIVFERLQELKIPMASASINVIIEGSKDTEAYICGSGDDGLTLSHIRLVHFDHPIANDRYDAYKKGLDFFTKTYSAAEKNSFYKYEFEVSDLKHIPADLKKMVLESERYTCSVAFTKNSMIVVNDFEGKSLLPEEIEVVKRFAKVFEQAYVRFLDLQKAEAQAREAEIELALERVRARTMAMRQQDELIDVITLLADQLVQLGIDLGVANFSNGLSDKDWDLWLYTNKAQPGNETRRVFCPWIDHPYFHEVKAAIANFKKGIDLSVAVFSKADKNSFLDHVFANTTYKDDYADLPDSVREFLYNSPGYTWSTIITKDTWVSICKYDVKPFTDKQNAILRRFTNAFGQAYTRFLDLQKAEAQAREAQIELSLERVRAKTMAMHNSNDVADTVATLFDEVIKLGVDAFRCGIGIMHNARQMEVWTAKPGENEKADLIVGRLDMMMHPLLTGAYNSWSNKNEYYTYELFGDDLITYFTAINNYPDYPISYDISALPKRIIHNEFHFAEGSLYVFSLSALSAETTKIFKRFAGVFGQTYRRYLDLQKAEEQAREAQIEAALERVRSRTLAMQESEELAETSAVLFKQLISLGIEPNRLYISIMRDDEGETEFWITDEDGSKVSSAYTDNLNTNASFKKMYDGWKEGKQSMIIDMQGEELQEYFQHLTSLGVPFKGGLNQKRRIQHLAYFNRGFIGMAAPDEQHGDTIHLLERFAAVFNLTFTRFSDLKIAEAHALQAEQDLIEIKTARKKAEEALAELQVTQNQLIQKEKMASLGELTAGIAHEIQNPLNFVNNFSEVSKELLDEMKAALESGNKYEAEEIANDIIKNLEKINHHGKRADAIVKGMLQHSQRSSGQKEPTDINTLCDEYLRLSYHGLRAKDKNFNADIKTDFDESIGKIDIIPQDIGRVLLNLYNNAFYACTERSRSTTNAKQKTVDENYKPLISVSTKRINDKVEIKVSDNGNGIPQNIVDKIFQPFFTTKPTGQGTGLGLSLSYDIIKAHGGELKVNTKENEGSGFTMVLPIS